MVPLVLLAPSGLSKPRLITQLLMRSLDSTSLEVLELPTLILEKLPHQQLLLKMETPQILSLSTCLDKTCSGFKTKFKQFKLEIQPQRQPLDALLLTITRIGNTQLSSILEPQWSTPQQDLLTSSC